MNTIPIQDVWFDDTATLMMGQVFERACKSLPTFRSAYAREMIAKRIIDAAKYGERDPAHLHRQVLIPFGIEDISVVSIARGDPVPGSVPGLCLDRV